jgi:hypothetical protein
MLEPRTALEFLSSSFGRSSYTGLHVMQNGYYFAGE